MAGAMPMHSTTSVPWAAIVPVVVLGVIFAIYCLWDLARRPSVRYLPRWAWAVICCISIPLGGIIYLAVGRGD